MGLTRHNIDTDTFAIPRLWAQGSPRGMTHIQGSVNRNNPHYSQLLHPTWDVEGQE